MRFSVIRRVVSVPTMQGRKRLAERRPKRRRSSNGQVRPWHNAETRYCAGAAAFGFFCVVVLEAEAEEDDGV